MSGNQYVSTLILNPKRTTLISTYIKISVMELRNWLTPLSVTAVESLTFPEDGNFLLSNVFSGKAAYFLSIAIQMVVQDEER